MKKSINRNFGTYILLMLMLAFHFQSKSQSNYYFGYQEGFKYGCQCYDLPTRNVAFSNGSYEQGYRDGKLDGVVHAQRKSNTNTQTYSRNRPYNYDNSPLYKPNYELIERSLIQKQTLLNQRREAVQAAYINILDIMLAAKKRNNGFTQSQFEYANWFKNEVEKLSGYDFTISENYNNVMNWFNRVKSNVLTW